MAEFVVTEELQAKVLAQMLHDREFCAVAGSHLRPEHFSNAALQFFFKHVATAGMSTDTLREELISSAKNKVITASEVPAYTRVFEVVKSKPLPVESDYIQGKLSTFIKTQAVKKAFEEGFSLAKEQKWEELVSTMQEAVQQGVDLSDLGHNFFADVEDRVMGRANRERARRIPTGVPELDSVTNGGIKNKQVGIIVGGTGRGKSIFLAWLARMAVLVGKRVVYFTFELSEDEIADRFDSMFAHVRPQELTDYQESILKEVGKVHKAFGSSLIIKHYPADSATVGTLKGFLNTLSGTGIQADLIIVDYLDLIKPHRQYSSPHDEVNAVMKSLVGFAAEYDVACYTATQMNRSGMAADTPDEASMAGYVGKQYHADMVWWMAQTKEEREDEQMRIWISKNRNGLAGCTVTLDTDYSHMTFYREPPPDVGMENIPAVDENGQILETIEL